MLIKKIPVVDLFAGPGGLAEGFSSVTDQQGHNIFDIRASVEKDPVAHQTLALRAIFRSFPRGKVPDCYYDYVRGHISKQDFLRNPLISEALAHAGKEANCATLGEDPSSTIDGWIKNAIGGHDPWVLIGGPPCQAYSLAGRSRMRGSDPKAFEEDKRHFLYKEYLRIIQAFSPAVFVMENVKGILSSSHNGLPIFDRILDDLSHPAPGLDYEIRSFVTSPAGSAHHPEDFVIRSELFGIPQMRHRVILLGIRSDHAHRPHELLARRDQPASVENVLSGLPKIRSRISREKDSFEEWLSVLRSGADTLEGWESPISQKMMASMRNEAEKSRHIKNTGQPFIPIANPFSQNIPPELVSWLHDARLGGVCQHESRSHMRSDLHRYLFSSCHARYQGHAPKLGEFPPELLPNHSNASGDNIPFEDRFRVQMSSRPSSTVVSHIAKDGHYYIHYDPAQCRSLTVREAARLQTFPDNYFFEGNRTQQYTQVGNAVPPFLAKQLGEIVASFLRAAR
jgi:DNA (cytosine-5)-methyltransferase 1